MIEKVAGLLHDPLEDTDITYSDLFEIEFPNKILDIVKLVTNEDIDKSNLDKEGMLSYYNLK